MARRDRLRVFLQAAFTVDDLRGLWHELDPEQAAELPGGAASLAQIVDATLSLIERRGADPRFFALLRERRPLRTAEIDALRAMAAFPPCGPNDAPAQPRWFPYPRAGSQRFVGRDRELAHLHDLLTRTRLVGITAQIRGLGGVGKSLLAIEYARRHGDAWPGGIFWIEADPTWSAASSAPHERLARRHAALASLAASLGACIDGDPACTAAAVERAVAEQTAGRRHLWILDDLPPGIDQAFVEALLPASPAGAMLITTRWMALDALPNRVDLDVLAADAAYALLTSRRAPRREPECVAAAALAADVGYHPLALDVLGALVRDDLSPSPYATWRARLAAPGDEFDRRAEALHDQLPTVTARAITRVIGTSLAQLRSSRSLLVLRIAAALGEAPLPGEMLCDVVASLGPCSDGELSGAVAELAAHALVTRVPDVAGIHVHAIVRWVARRLVNAWPANHTIDTACCEALGKRFAAADDTQQHRDLLTLLPHAEHAARGDVDEAFLLGGNLGHFAQLRGDYPAAQWHAERALRHFDGRLVAGNPFTAHTRNNLAVALRLQGDWRGAEIHFGQVLVDYERLYGRNHRSALMALHNLGTTFEARGDYVAARRVYEEVLAHQRIALGPTDRDTLYTLMHLGGMLSDCGELVEARALLEPAVPLFEAALGPEDPRTLDVLAFLAVVLKRMDELAAARALEERVLSAYRRLFGADHPGTLMHAQQLARTLQMQGELDTAMALAAATLAIQCRVLGPNHPQTLVSQHGVAITHMLKGEFEAALPLLEATLAEMPHALTPGHPQVLIVQEDLAWVFVETGRKREAIALLEQVLAGRVAIFRPDCSDILQVRYKLAGTLLALGDRDAAAPHLVALQSLRARDADTLSRSERSILGNLDRLEHHTLERPLLILRRGPPVSAAPTPTIRRRRRTRTR